MEKQNETSKKTFEELEKEIQKNYPEATQLASIVSKLQEMNK